MRLEMYEEGSEKLRAWRAAIKKRLGDFAEDKREKGHLVRKIGWKGKEAVPALGPRDEVLIKAERTRGGSKRLEASANDDIPLVEGDAPFFEERTQSEDASGMSPAVESFLRDTVDTPVDAPVEAPVEATVPPVADAEKKAHKRSV